MGTTIFRAIVHGLILAVALLPLAAGAATCTPRGFSAGEERVLEGYIAYYGRPADVAGLGYWAQRLADGGGELAVIIDAFGVSAEFDDRFGSLNDESLIRNLYQQLFGREPDPPGLAFYLGELTAGRMNLQSIALNILYGVQGDDVAIVANRLTVSGYFVACMEQGHFGYPSIPTAVDILATVGADAASLTAAIAAIDALATPVADRLSPADLVYQGAFRLPDHYNWGARGLAYDPAGNGGTGSLLVTAFQGLMTPAGEPCYEGLDGCAAYFGEVTIPEPVSSDSWEALPMAMPVRTPTVFDGGLVASVEEAYTFVSGIELVPRQATQETDKLYGSLNAWYPEGSFGEASFPTVWYSELDGSDARGVFHVGPNGDPLYHGRKMGEYLFTVPQWYADAYLGGRTLVTGRSRGTPLADPMDETGGGSQGPALFAFAPWPSDSPGTELDALPMLYYRPRFPECAGPDIGVGGQPVDCDFPGYTMSDEWNGASFIEGPAGRAILIQGRKASTNCYYCDETGSDPECPVMPLPGECDRWCNEGRGYHGGPYRRQVLFYDVDELGQAATGARDPWTVAPYQVWEPAELLLQPVDGNVCGDVGGMAFDTAGRRLFLVERGLGGYENENAAVVHVWSLGGE